MYTFVFLGCDLASAVKNFEVVIIIKRDLFHTCPRSFINWNSKLRGKVVAYGQIGGAINGTPAALNLDADVFRCLEIATADRDMLFYYEFNIIAALNDGGV